MVSKDDVHIEVTMTNNCNCNCQYCFESCHSGFSRDIEEEKRQLDLILDFCQRYDQRKYRFLTLSFWGGEPFLNTEFMFKLIEQTCKYSFVRYHIYSNGTLLEQVKSLLEQSFFESIKDRIHIQLSYDGEPHNTLKRRDTRETIFKTAEMLIQHGLTPMFKATLAFDMIHYLPQIWDSYKEAYDRFGSWVSYAPTLDTASTDPSKIDEWESALVKVAQRERRFFREHGHFLMSWFNSPKKCNCKLANSMHLDTDGTVYVCHGCPYSSNKEAFVLGHTKDMLHVEECLLDSSLNTHENQKCLECEAVYCAVCHVHCVDGSCKTHEELASQWIENRPNCIDRCKYYQVFGKIYNALTLSLLD